MGEMLLAGCTAEPLMGYLKAIGLLRIVAAQLDPKVTAQWVDDTFCLETSVNRDELIDFMVNNYSPAPIITPWNKGSGFAPGDIKSSPQAFRNVAAIESSSDVRLVPLQEAIAAARQAVGHDLWEGLEKADQVSLLRGLLPDEALGWLDAAVVLTSDGRAFPPLLGTGGNDGRFDFGSNYLDRVATVMGAGVPPKSLVERRGLLTYSLFAEGTVRLDQAAIGQFDPAASGGPGSSPFGKAESLANPWDLVLLFEGAIAFASGVARKFGAAQSSSAVPFTVAGVSAGYATSVVESCRGEFWAPIWRRSASAAELMRFIAEGRAEFGGRQARNGLDVARALATLGVDRGIDEFIRFAFLERNGLATYCIPVGRQKVAASERQDVAAFKQLDPWLNRVRRTKNLPASAAALLRRIDGQRVCPGFG